MPKLPTRAPLGPAGLLATTVVTAVLVVGLGAGGAGARPASPKAQAKRELLALADMPAGWSVEKGSSASTSNNFPGAKQLARCIGVSSRLLSANPPGVNSPYFQNPGGSLEVQDSVSVFPSARTARAEFTTMANARTPACMTTLMNGPFKAQLTAAAGSGATVGTVTVTRAQSAGYGRGTSTMVMTLPITEQEVPITAKLAVVFYRRGRFVQQIEFNSYGVAFPASTAKALTAAAIQRLQGHGR